MTRYIGFLFWYSLGEHTVTMSMLRQHMQEIGMDLTAAPKAILPIDVFRRLTGTRGQYATYTLDDTKSVRLGLRPARETNTLISRAVTRTILEDGKPVDRSQVGEFVFYRPPRGEPERSRVRLTFRDIANLPDKDKVERFGTALRDEYSNGKDHLDPQALRRVVRAYLTLRHALLIDKVYFIPDVDTVSHLHQLIDHVGGSRAWSIPIDDTSGTFLRAEFIDAAKQGKVSPEMLALYMQIPGLQVLPADLVQQIKGDTDAPTT